MTIFAFNGDMKKGDPMRLQKLEIERVPYGEMKGQYKGQIQFEGPTGAVALTLTAEQCAKLFTVVADGVIGTAREVAETLTREAMATIAKPADLQALVDGRGKA